MGTIGSLKVTFAKICVIPSTAGCIKGEWKAALTCSGIARAAPFALAISPALVIFSVAPLMTSCPGLLMFAITVFVSLQISASIASSMPIIAIIPPGVCNPASNINRPRSFARKTAVLKSIALAAAKAVYSPRLCPAMKDGAGRFFPPTSCAALRQAMLTATSAGWALLVFRSSSSGPSKNIFESEKPTASSACLKSVFTESKLS